MSISTVHSLSGEVGEARRQPRNILTNNLRLPSLLFSPLSSFSECRSSSSWDASTMVPAIPSCPSYQARRGFEYSHKTEENVIAERSEVTGEGEPSVK